MAKTDFLTIKRRSENQITDAESKHQVVATGRHQSSKITRAMDNAAPKSSVLLPLSCSMCSPCSTRVGGPQFPLEGACKLEAVDPDKAETSSRAVIP